MALKTLAFGCLLLFCCLQEARVSSWARFHNGIITSDQYLLAGTSVNITCSAFKKYNSSTLTLKVWMNDNQLTTDVNVANETAVYVTIDGNVPGKRRVYCYGMNGNGKQKYIAHSIVNFGYPPHPVEDLHCVVENMAVLKCNWTKPRNPIRTSYSAILTYASYESYNSTSKSSDTAEWEVGHYDANKDNFTLIITGENKLGNRTNAYEISGDEIVLPNPPRNFVAEENDTGLDISWKLPEGTVSLPYIMERMDWIQELQYRTHRDPLDQWTVAYNDTAISDVTEVYMDAYPHTTYTLRVRLRSSRATEDYWSKSAEIAIETRPKAPTRPPIMTFGSFEPFVGIKDQNITIFWKVLEDFQKNGPQFFYEAYAFNHETQTSRNPVDMRLGAYATFEHLDLSSTYTFTVKAVNSEGSSPTSSLTLPPADKFLKPPVNVEVVSHGNGSFEVTWKPPKDIPAEPYSYTVFYCFYEYGRPYTCNGTLDWDVVEAGQTWYTFHSPDKSENYQYGVAINTEDSSSGIVWASCTVLSSNMFGKIDDVEVTDVRNTSMRVQWVLDCSDKWSSIEAVNISYCIADIDQRLCIGSVNSTIIPSQHKNAFGGVISGLEPLTFYKITVAAMRGGIIGKQSDALYKTTDEGAPEDKPTNVTVEEVGTDMAILTWEPPINPRGIIRRYVVHVGDLTDETNHSRMEFRGLSSFQNYMVHVAACTKGDRCGPASDPISLQTDVTAPGRMDQPDIEFLNSTYVKVSWYKPDEPNGLVDIYQLRLTKDDLQEPKILNTTETSLIVELDCEGEDDMGYAVDVQAVNINQDDDRLVGEWSVIRSFKCSFFGALDPGLLAGFAVGGAIIVSFLVFVAYVWHRASESHKIPPINVPNLLKNGAVTLISGKLKEKSEKPYHAEEFDVINAYYLERFNNSRSSTNSRELMSSNQDSNQNNNNNEQAKSEVAEEENDAASVEEELTQMDPPPDYVVVATPDTGDNNNHMITMADQLFVPSTALPSYVEFKGSSDPAIPQYVLGGKASSSVSSSNPDVGMETNVNNNDPLPINADEYVEADSAAAFPYIKGASRASLNSESAAAAASSIEGAAAVYSNIDSASASNNNGTATDASNIEHTAFPGIKDAAALSSNMENTFAASCSEEEKIPYATAGGYVTLPGL